MPGDLLKALTPCWEFFDCGKTLLEILDHLPDGLLIMDNHCRIEYFNRAAEDITGLHSAQVLGADRSTAFKRFLAETEYSTAGMSLPPTDSARAFTIKRPDGSLLHILSVGSVLTNREGTVIGTYEVIKDISSRKILEDGLRFSETKYRRLFEGSKDMIFITSCDGKVREVNQACLDLLGYASAEELRLLPGIEEIYNNPVHWRVFQKQINLHGFVKDFDSNFKKKDGTRVHCLLSGNAVRDDRGEIVEYEGVAKDITARTDATRNLRQRQLEMRILNSVALAMNKSQDLDTILEIALKKVLEALRLFSGAIFIIEPGPKETTFSMRAQQGIREEGRHSCSFEIKFCDDVLMRALLAKDLYLDPQPIFPSFKVVLKTMQSQEQELTCFLITAKEKASGFLAFAVPPGRDITTGKDFHLLGSVANFLGGAIQNANLLQTVRQHKEELQGLTAKLYKTLDIERKRIAQDLHDETGQSLMAIRLTLEALERDFSTDQARVTKALEEAKEQIERAHQEIRRISHRLHPALLSELGLEPALDAYFSEIAKKADLKIAYTITGFEERVDSEIETTLYRISQEALNNAIRHSRAKYFKLSIIKSYPNIIFMAQDDGIGMNYDLPAYKKQSLGLVGMRERVHMLNGRFSISFSNDNGTRIRAEIPLKESHFD